MSLREHQEGAGKLVSCSSPGREYQIPYYSYDHYLDLVERRRGFPLIPVHIAAIQIQTPDAIPEGKYYLETESEIIYLQYLGGSSWEVVAGP